MIDRIRLRNAIARLRPRFVFLRPQELHLIRLSLESSYYACEEYPGGPSPRSRTEQYQALAERFKPLDPKDDFE